MNFTKMHGIGNDFICVNGFEEYIEYPGELAKVLCDRHFGIGADGLLLILPPDGNSSSEQADCRMELYNADGSRAQMCGNGIRCVGKYVYEHGLVRKTSLVVETLAGVRKMELKLCGDNAAMIGAAAYNLYKAGKFSDENLNADPSLELPYAESMLK